MYTKVLDLIERNRLVFGCRNVGRRVVLRVRAECTNIYFTSGDRTVGVDLREIRQRMGTKPISTYHNGDEWVLELLVRHLSVDIDAG